MYDKAPKCLDSYINAGTKAHVGPGTYELELNRSAFPLYLEVNLAPFLSSTKRFSSKYSGTPGPSDYALPNVIGTKNVGSMKFTEPRFKVRKPCGPGPNAYTKPGLVGKGLYDLRRLEKPKHDAKMIHAKVRYCLHPTVPSIPMRTTQGYETTDDGGLVKVKEINADTTLGPARYEVPREDPSTTTYLYKGNFWSHSTGRRMPSSRATPGPGDYDIGIPPTKELLHFPRADLKIHRFMDKLVHDAHKYDFPGPANYNPAEPEVPYNLAECFRSLPAFASSQKRFNEPQPRPGPGDYVDKTREALSIVKKVVSHSRKAAFGAIAPRFTSETSTYQPAPTTYNIKGLSENMKGRNLKRHGKRVAFDTSSDRLVRLVPKQYLINPGPGRYGISRQEFPLFKPFPPTPTQRTRTKRKPCKEILPSPGDYDTVQAYDFIYKKSSFLKQNDDVAFLTSDRRFQKRKGFGPGFYNLSKPSCKLRNAMKFSIVKRFSEKVPDKKPVATTYKVHPLYADSVLKGTFNTKLNNPIPRHVATTKWRTPTFTPKPPGFYFEVQGTENLLTEKPSTPSPMPKTPPPENNVEETPTANATTTETKKSSVSSENGSKN